MNKKQGQSDWISIIKGAGIGAGGSLLVTLALTALAAKLVSQETIGEASLDAVTAAILVMSSICGSLLAASATGHHRLQICLATGGLYFGMLLSCTALLFDGVYENVGVTALAILGGCGAVILMGLKEGKKRGSYRRPKKVNWKVVQN